MSKLISIVTPVHNSEQFLRQCIDSVLAQTYDNWEQILIDDYSFDNSTAIIKSYQKQDSRIKHHRLEQNSGAGIARNRAIEMAQGEYIAFLDSDDVWLPDKLLKQLTFMQENNYHFTFTSYGTMNEIGELTPKVFHAKKKITYAKALYKNPIGCLTVMYSVDFFGKQYMDSIRKRQDFALWLKLLKKTDGYGLQEVLATYRYGNESISSNKLGLLKYEWKLYREVEGLSFFKSAFYLLSAVVLKLKSYF